MKHKKPLVLAALAAGLMSITAQAAQPTLFSEHLIPAPSMRQANRFIGKLASEPSTRQLQVVQARAAQVDTTTERLYLNLLPGSAPLVVDQLTSYRNSDGTVVWNGLVGGTAAAAARLKRHGPKESLEDPLNTATIVRNGDMLTGSVRVEGRLYRIEPVGQGKHVIVEVNEDQLPPDDGGDPLPMGDARMFVPPARPEDGEPTVVRVMVVYSKHASDDTADPTGWAQAMVADANSGYAGSGVKVVLQLVSAQRSAYREFSAPSNGTKGRRSFETDLARFRGKNDGYLDGFHALRDESAADVMVLVRRHSNYACGLAPVFATEDTAFAVMGRDCGPGHYTFHHEIGHLQGALHDPHHNYSTSPFSYGHGFISRRGHFSTVMAYWPDDGSAPRVKYFSNPDRYIGDVPMGTNRTHDNARVLNETRTRVGSFR